VHRHYKLVPGGILFACVIDLGIDVSEFPFHALAATPLSSSEFLGEEKKISCLLLLLYHNTLDTQFIAYPRVAQIILKYRSHLKIVGGRSLT